MKKILLFVVVLFNQAHAQQVHHIPEDIFAKYQSKLEVHQNIIVDEPRGMYMSCEHLRLRKKEHVKKIKEMKAINRDFNTTLPIGTQIELMERFSDLSLEVSRTFPSELFEKRYKLVVKYELSGLNEYRGRRRISYSFTDINRLFLYLSADGLYEYSEFDDQEIEIKDSQLFFNGKISNFSACDRDGIKVYIPISEEYYPHEPWLDKNRVLMLNIKARLENQEQR